MGLSMVLCGGELQSQSSRLYAPRTHIVVTWEENLSLPRELRDIIIYRLIWAVTLCGDLMPHDDVSRGN